jgi:hypothetical protein
MMALPSLITARLSQPLEAAHFAPRNPHARGFF